MCRLSGWICHFSKPGRSITLGVTCRPIAGRSGQRLVAEQGQLLGIAPSRVKEFRDFNRIFPEQPCGEFLGSKLAEKDLMPTGGGVPGGEGKKGCGAPQIARAEQRDHEADAGLLLELGGSLKGPATEGPEAMRSGLVPGVGGRIVCHEGSLGRGCRRWMRGTHVACRTRPGNRKHHWAGQCEGMKKKGKAEVMAGGPWAG